MKNLRKAALEEHARRGLKNQELYSIVDTLLANIDFVRLIDRIVQSTTNVIYLPGREDSSSIYIQLSIKPPIYPKEECYTCFRQDNCSYYDKNLHMYAESVVGIIKTKTGRSVVTFANNCDITKLFLNLAFSQNLTPVNVMLGKDLAYAKDAIEQVDPMFNCRGEFIGRVSAPPVAEEIEIIKKKIDTALETRNFEVIPELNKKLQKLLR